MAITQGSLMEEWEGEEHASCKANEHTDGSSRRKEEHGSMARSSDRSPMCHDRRMAEGGTGIHPATKKQAEMLFQDAPFRQIE